MSLRQPPLPIRDWHDPRHCEVLWSLRRSAPPRCHRGQPTGQVTVSRPPLDARTRETARASVDEAGWLSLGSRA